MFPTSSSCDHILVQASARFIPVDVGYPFRLLVIRFGLTAHYSDLFLRPGLSTPPWKLSLGYSLVPWTVRTYTELPSLSSLHRICHDALLGHSKSASGKKGT